MSALVFGFDPGGIDRFGCAAWWPESGELKCASLSYVDEVLHWARQVADGVTPCAAGLDTLLFWQTGPSGWRGADEWLRARYRAVQASVMHPNGLQGSMSIQGPCLAFGLRDLWPNLPLNETHPKVLWASLYSWEYPRIWPEATGPALWCEAVGMPVDALGDEHQLDAALSAWAAWQGVSGAWAHNLFDEVARRQTRPNRTFVDGVTYYWPE
jgi:hypothetical protein